MLTLSYEGWLECRLATDPDPTDEPRGLSGWTFAMHDEPPLDRIIRPQPKGTVGRRFGPKLGVNVRGVSLDGEPQPNHPLVGAPIELLDNPVFEGRNGLAAEDTLEPIIPFHLRIRQAGVLLRREMRDPMTGKYPFVMPVNAGPWTDLEAVLGISNPAEYQEHRKQTLHEALKVTMNANRRRRIEQRLEELEKGAQVTVAEAFRERRRVALKEALAQEQDPIARVALEKREADMVAGALHIITELTIGLSLNYRYVMEGLWLQVEDTENVLGGVVGTTPWTATFSVGVWDADTLSAYMRGTLDLPFERNA